MPTLGPKRQITLPRELCDSLDIAPGDPLFIFEHHGRITIVKQSKGASAGILRHLRATESVSEDESLLGAVAEWRAAHRRPT